MRAEQFAWRQYPHAYVDHDKLRTVDGLGDIFTAVPSVVVAEELGHLVGAGVMLGSEGRRYGQVGLHARSELSMPRLAFATQPLTLEGDRPNGRLAFETDILSCIISSTSAVLRFAVQNLILSSNGALIASSFLL
ncbi:hypothetical protein [Paracoccus homiensis]|uniref:hypothetical protein n=1 Tax=Paracoccus homiensis TaxID=364199 RepID=UPI0015876F06|nr:hypothetical protein [Paracoccus homiensis]